MSLPIATSDQKTLGKYPGTYDIEIYPSQIATPEEQSTESLPQLPFDVEKSHGNRLWKLRSLYRSVNTFITTPDPQLTILGILFFLGPGMFCALNGLGGGGLGDPVLANNANTAVYSALALVGFFSGPIVNKIGFRASLSLGGLGYTLYASSLLCYKLTGNVPYMILAGIFLGVVSSLMWTTQGAMLLSYPKPEQKGRFISVVWSLFNLGAALGSLIVFAQSIHSSADGISTNTYIGFITLMATGVLLAQTIRKIINMTIPLNVTTLAPIRKTILIKELKTLLNRLSTDPYILLLFPMFFVSNYYYPYQFNDINLSTFNVRTRALNNTLYWASEIPGSFLLGWILDLKFLKRAMRAKIASVLLGVLMIGIWGGGYVWQRGYSREEVTVDGFPLIDFSDRDYVRPAFLFIAYGLFDGIWQSYIYWSLGVLSSDSSCAADFTGFYKGLQSAGAAVAYSVNVKKNPFLTDFWVCWGMLIGSFLVGVPTVLFKIGRIESGV